MALDFDMTDLLQDFMVPVTLTRPISEAVSVGFVTEIKVPILGATGHMQPLSPRELRNVPEGQNTLEWWNVWSQSEIRVKDIVTEPGKQTVVIQRVETWVEGKFWHAQGTKVTDFTDLPSTYVTGVGSAVGRATVSGHGGHL